MSKNHLKFKIRNLIGMYQCNPENWFYILLSIGVHSFWQGGRSLTLLRPTLVYNIFTLGCCPQYDTNNVKWIQLSFSMFVLPTYVAKGGHKGQH